MFKECNRLFDKVNSIFNDVDKTLLWFKTPNPLMGNVAPLFLIYSGRLARLEEFIDNAIEENNLENNK